MKLPGCRLKTSQVLCQRRETTDNASERARELSLRDQKWESCRVLTTGVANGQYVDGRLNPAGIFTAWASAPARDPIKRVSTRRGSPERF